MSSLEAFVILAGALAAAALGALGWAAYRFLIAKPKPAAGAPADPAGGMYADDGSSDDGHAG